MGEVWRGFDVELGRAVAVKVLLEFDAGDELLRRFRREASIGARLQHPGITVVHDVGQYEHRLFIVMELLEGTDLAGILARLPGGLPIAEAADLALQTAEALAAAHAGKVVHRDLKPGNLFLQADGRLKICDFGIAHSADATGGLTVTGRPFGTPAYMAPEQWRGEHVGAQCDMYALGCVLYALVAGTPPFPADEQAWVLMRRHLDEVPPGLRTVRADVPAEVETLVASLLAKEPAARPDATTTAELLRAMQRTTPDLPDVPEPGTTLTALTPARPRLAEPVQDSNRPADSGGRRHSRRTILTLGAVAAAGAVATSAAVWLADSDGRSDRTTASTDTSHPATPTPTASASLPVSKAVPLTSNGDEVSAVAFSPDGKTLAGGRHSVASAKEGVFIDLWNVGGGRTPVRDKPDRSISNHGRGISCLVYSPDGKTVACGGFDQSAATSGSRSGYVQIWEVATGRALTGITSDQLSINSLAFSPDGKTIAGGGSGNGSSGSVITLWDAATGHTIRTLKVYDARHLAFNPDGGTIAVRATNTSVELRDVATGGVTASFDTGTSVAGLAFNSVGNRLAVGRGGGNDGKITLYQNGTVTTPTILAGHNFDQVAYTPDEQLAIGGNGTVVLWDSINPKIITSITSNGADEGDQDLGVNSLAVSPDGKTVAGCGGSLFSGAGAWLWRPPLAG